MCLNLDEGLWFHFPGLPYPMQVLTSLQLERSDHAPGDTLRGTVGLHLERGHEATAMDLEVYWRYKPERGRPHSHLVVGTRLELGDMPAGTHQVPFSMALPTHHIPRSLDTEFVSISWWVKASISLPWALDPSMITPFEMRSESPYLHLPEQPLPKHIERPKSLVVFLWLGGLGVLGVLFWMVNPLLWKNVISKDESLHSLYNTIGLVLAVPFGLLMLWVGKEALTSSRAIRDPRTTLEPKNPHPGQPFTYTFVFTSGARLRTPEVRMVLRGEVHLRKPGGRRKGFRARTKELVVLSLIVEQNQGDVSPGQTASYTGRGVIPHDADPSLYIRRMSQRWCITTTISTEDYPDWDHHEDILVGRDDTGSTTQDAGTMTEQAAGLTSLPGLPT